MRFLIVDDHAAVRRLIRGIVEGLAEDIEECDDGMAALAAYRRKRADLVFMDLRMRYLDGLEATRLIRELDPSAKVLIVTDYDDPTLRQISATAGACGFQLKENLTELPQLIAMVLRGE